MRIAIIGAGNRPGHHPRRHHHPQLGEGNLLEEGFRGRYTVLSLRRLRLQDHLGGRLPDEQPLCPGFAFKETEPAHAFQLQGLDAAFYAGPGIGRVAESERYVFEFLVAGQAWTG